MIFPIPPRAPFGQEEAAYWDDFLTDAEINMLLARPEWLQCEAGSIGGLGAKAEVNTAVRETQVAWLGAPPELQAFWAKLASVVAEVNRRHFRFDLTGFHEPIQLGIYAAANNGHYDWHVDSCVQDTKVPRKLSMALLLSDPSEFEGGEFQIKVGGDEAITLQTKRGRAWFFPSYMLHRVTPVTKGVRRSVVTWAGGPAFR